LGRRTPAGLTELAAERREMGPLRLSWVNAALKRPRGLVSGSISMVKTSGSESSLSASASSLVGGGEGCLFWGLEGRGFGFGFVREGRLATDTSGTGRDGCGEGEDVRRRLFRK